MIHLHPTNLIAVPVQEESEKFDVQIVNTNKWLQYSMPYGKSSEIILEDCNLKILGTVTKDTIDFDPEPYVEKDTHFSEKYFKWYHTDFKSIETFRKDISADYSFRSLLTANDALFENPYGGAPNHAGFNLTGHPIMDAAIKKNIQWQTAQAKVNSKYVILGKI